MLRIETIQMSKCMQQILSGRDRNSFLDITIKTGSVVFAPSWNIVMGLKNHTITEEQYATEYRQLMLQSYRNYNVAWKNLLSKDEVILACYCRSGDFCHRTLLANYLVKLGAVYVGEIL